MKTSIYVEQQQPLDSEESSVQAKLTAMSMFRFAESTFVRDLPGAYHVLAPDVPPAPKVVRANRSLAAELGIDPEALESETAARQLAGHDLGQPAVAMAYAGHQFGGFARSLGDGRAALLGEVIDSGGRRLDLHLKGSGPTRFARGGDGKATVGPMLRELLMGEAMHALGIPTTRALAVVLTGEQVRREQVLPGAVMLRVAASHLRIGTFEYFAARDDGDMLQRLIAYALERHGPWPVEPADRGRVLLEAVIARQASLVAHWMAVGFIHGVMNTDNMTISGQTIDYGPCAFMDRYDPQTVYSSIDHHGRYAYGNQPKIALWNLARFAEALLPTLASNREQATEVAVAALEGFQPAYEQQRRARFAAKLGIEHPEVSDDSLTEDFLTLLWTHSIDFTSAFRALLPAALGDAGAIDELGPTGALAPWRERWLARTGNQADVAAGLIERTNPVHIARNHRVEDALTAAIGGDLRPFDALLDALRAPFAENAQVSGILSPPSRERERAHRTFCGT